MLVLDQKILTTTLINMKNLFLLLLITPFIFSCVDAGGDTIYDGFTFRISNRTNQVYEGEIFIGTLKNSNFIAIDSIKFERKLEIGGSTLLSHFIGGNRWKPNLDKIKSLSSERCYFKLKLSSDREELVTRYNSTDLFSLLLPNKNFFEGDFGEILLNISDSQISGSAAMEIE